MTHLEFRFLSAVALTFTLLGCQPLHDLDAVSHGGPGPTSDAAQQQGSPTGESPPSPGSAPGQAPAASPSEGAGSPTDSLPSTALTPNTSSAPPVTSNAPESTEPVNTRSSAGPGETSSTQPDTTSSSAPDATSSTQPVDPTAPDSGAPTTIATSTQGATDSSQTSSHDSNECQARCGQGDSCTSATQCLSLRCNARCEPTELRVESDGLDAISTSIKVHVELYADPAVPVAWEDLAVLYFFTVERRDDFVMHFEMGGGTAMPMQVGLNDWILVWRSNAAGNVPSTVTPFDVQFRSDPWLPDTPESNDNANDHSYREGLGPNDNIVLCRQTSDGWKHIQGTPPANIADPCSYVGNCDAAILCDPLQPAE